MQDVVAIGRLVFFAWLLVFPQLLGVLFYFRLGRLPNWVARTLASIAPAVTFIFIAPVFLFAGMREAQMRHEGCGMGALGALIVLFYGTIFELIIGISVQILMRVSKRS